MALLGKGRRDFPAHDPALRAYMENVGRVKVIGAKELRSLFQTYRRSQSQAQRNEIADRIWNANLRLVIFYVARSPRIPPDKIMDAIQEGNLGLQRAIVKFDPDRGVRFSTYALHWIRAYSTRILEERTHASLEEILRIEESGDAQEPGLVEALRFSGLSPEEAVVAHEDQQRKQDRVRKALNKVRRKNKRFAPIIKERLLAEEGECTTLLALGARFGVTRERVRQIEAMAYNHLVEAIKKAGPLDP